MSDHDLQHSEVLEALRRLESVARESGDCVAAMETSRVALVMAIRCGGLLKAVTVSQRIWRRAYGMVDRKNPLHVAASRAHLAWLNEFNATLTAFTKEGDPAKLDS